MSGKRAALAVCVQAQQDLPLSRAALEDALRQMPLLMQAYERHVLQVSERPRYSLTRPSLSSLLEKKERKGYTPERACAH